LKSQNVLNFIFGKYLAVLVTHHSLPISHLIVNHHRKYLKQAEFLVLSMPERD